MKKSTTGVLSKRELRSEFRRMVQSRGELRNTPGTWCVDSGEPGPTLGITIHTHGNEPSGLATVHYLRKKWRIDKRLKAGEVIFVLNNIKATEAYLRARGEKTIKRSRFVDLNMNRLPNNLLDLLRTGRFHDKYEIKRAVDLLPVWNEFDVGLDIHTTTADSKPMIIAPNKVYPQLMAGFPIDVLISNIGAVMRGKPVAAFYGPLLGVGTPIPTLAIEAGSHENPRSVRIAVECVKALLRNLKMIDGGIPVETPHERQLYRIRGSLILPDRTYQLTRVFDDFEAVYAGLVLATSDQGGVPIRAIHDGHVLLGPKQLKPFSIDEEAFFISDRVSTVTY